MLVHPVWRENQQLAAPRLDPQIKMRKRGFTALGDVVEIPNQDEIPIADEIDGIEMQLKLFLLAGPVTLHDQFGCQWGVWYGYRQSDIIVVACQGVIDELAKHSEEMDIRQRRDIQFGPRRLFKTRPNAAAVRALESSQPRERLDHAPAQALLETVIVNAHVMGQVIDGHMTEWNL